MTSSDASLRSRRPGEIFSLYIHVPFCRHRCAYCDFNTYAGYEELIPAYVKALCAEITYVGNCAASRLLVHTVFFGGGTPSLLAAPQFERILGVIQRHFDLMTNAEVTIEANPGTVSREGLKQLRSVGINRISFGAQSANTEELRMLERAHGFPDVIRSVEWARRGGFENLNLDLIYGLPEQSLGTWKITVRRILDLNPEHISAYALTLEHGTPFGRWSQRGLMPVPDPDAAAEMYEWASDAFEAAGYGQYEISNWARDRAAQPALGGPAGGQRPAGTAVIEPPQYACRHNLQYWRGLAYLGLGAGAHGYANGYRYSNLLRIRSYIDRMQDQNGPATQIADCSFPMSPAAVNRHDQSAEDDMSEFMITGLRLTREGIDPATFRARFGIGIMGAYGEKIEELQRLGLLEWVKKSTSDAGEAAEVLRITQRGRLLGNQVFLRFV